jgi:hypothetical protein
MKLMHRLLGLALLLAAVTTTAGCVFVPAGPGYAYRPVAPVVVAPAPAVVVRRPYYYGYWW